VLSPNKVAASDGELLEKRGFAIFVVLGMGVTGDELSEVNHSVCLVAEKYPKRQPIDVIGTCYCYAFHAHSLVLMSVQRTLFL